jgi:hypothetical protein
MDDAERAEARRARILSARYRPAMAQSSPQPGFYTDESGRRRWWSGTEWTDVTAIVRDGELTDQERRAILDRAVTKYVERGYRVDSNTGRQAVVSKRQRVHLLSNLLLTLVTGGLWLIVLAIRLLNWPSDRAVLTVDASGRLQGEFSS